MTITFEGQTFPTLKAFGDAFPAYRNYGGLVRAQGITTIPELERAISARATAGRQKSAAASRQASISAYSRAARIRGIP